MQEKPSVAICIPTYNQAQYLPESVGSACRQNYENVEVWVSDDASTDDTPQVMAQLCQQFPQVRYYRQPKNMGIAGNNTWLMSQPTTEFIIRLDSDDVLKPHYVQTLVALLTPNIQRQVMPMPPCRKSTNMEKIEVFVD
jgi:glycosyltransferase involved in cell wall biosynthesis